MRHTARTHRGGPPAARAAAGVMMGLLAAFVLWVAAPPPASSAAVGSGEYEGGIYLPDAPAVMLNDSTVYGVRFTATGLLPSAPYFVKVRISPVPSGKGQSRNRGFTWNRNTSRWVHERENTGEWALFPQVTTDGSGNIPLDMAGDGNWLFTKFSDETTAGTYYMVVSLSNTGAGNTLNASVVQTVTIVNAATQGGWVHNAAPVGASGARIDAVAGALTYAMSKTETNSVDDDGNGVTDDENWCDLLMDSRLTSFRLGVPIGTVFTVRTEGSPWDPAGIDRQVVVPDTDMALGAADTSAPTRPGAPTAVASKGGKVTLDWGASNDDNSLHGYHVYRWNDPVPIVGLVGVYTPTPVRIGTVTGGATTFEDTGAPEGKSAHYHIRAFDTSSNVSPRSLTVTAMPDGTGPALGMTFTAPPGKYHDTGVVSIRATDTVSGLASISYRVDSGVTQTVAFTSATSGETLVSIPVSVDPTHTVTCVATDNTGNESAVQAATLVVVPTPALDPVYRFYNWRTNTHFFTASLDEKRMVEGRRDWPFTYECIAYQGYRSPDGNTPLYRFYNWRTNTHFYTAREAEKNMVLGRRDWPFTYEDIAYYVSMDPTDRTAVHRFYNYRTNTHFYTSSEAEKNMVLGRRDWPFTYEDIAYYVAP